MIMSTSTNVKVAVATMLVLACASLVSCRNETVITVGQLPEAAQNFLREYFPESPVSYVKKEKELKGSTYEAVLQDGTEIDFDSKGERDNADCKSATVPAAIVPSAVMSRPTSRVSPSPRSTGSITASKSSWPADWNSGLTRTASS